MESTQISFPFLFSSIYNIQSTSANSNTKGNKNMFELPNIRINERILPVSYQRELKYGSN